MKYNIGDKVYTITSLDLVIKELCSACNGDGKIISNGHEVRCPKYKRIKKKKYVTDECFEIESILYQNGSFYYASENVDFEQDYDSYIPQFYKEDELFESEDMAISMIKILNNENKI